MSLAKNKVESKNPKKNIDLGREKDWSRVLQKRGVHTKIFLIKFIMFSIF